MSLFALKLGKLRCEKQEEAGDDEIYIRGSGLWHHRYSNQDSPIARYRLPGKWNEGNDHWDMRNDQNSKREIVNITLWSGNLDDGDSVSLTLEVREDDGEEGNPTNADRVIGSVNVSIEQLSASTRVRCSPLGGDTQDGQCAPEADQIGRQRFKMLGGGSEYVMWIQAPGTC